MMQSRRHYADFHDYIAGLTEEERHELAAADMALDIAALVELARKERGLTREEAARRAGIQQHVASRLEHPQGDIQLDALRQYLEALGYTVEIGLKDSRTGQVIGHVTLPSQRRTA